MNVAAKPVDRVFRRIPTSELERRWRLLRSHMAEINVQAVVATGFDDWLGGYIRWLTDRPASNSYNSAVIFHADSPMTIMEHGPLEGRRTLDGDPDYPGAAELFTTAAWRSINYTRTYEPDIVCDVLRHRGYRRIGVIGAAGMPHNIAEALFNLGAEIIDVTEFVDRCKAIKSEAELVEIRATAKMQEEIFDALLTRIEPGMRDQDIMAIIQHEGRRRGSEQGVFLVSSQILGQPTLMATPHFQGRRFERGDHICVLIENNGPAGFYTELGRTVVLGKSTPALNDSMELTVAAQKNTVRRLTAGTACADIAAAHDQFLKEAGLATEKRLYAHGQGYDLVERPLIRRDEPGKLEGGMNIVVHPTFVSAGAFGWVCDNYVTRDGGPPEPLHRTAQKIFEI